MKKTEEFPSKLLEDRFGRGFPYLRLSITDICNFRCQYCLPNGYNKPIKKTSFLTLDEIRRLIDVFADLGVYKIRLTGGEPTIRKDFIEIIKMISAHPFISQLACTTNGYRLEENVHQWHQAGLTHINISIDSLNSERFKAITGHCLLEKILKGVETALNAGFKKVKLNTVLLKNTNEDELETYLNFIHSRSISVRFIELMQTGDHSEYFKTHHLNSETIKTVLLQQGWLEINRQYESGPAQEYKHPDYQGSIGIIAPYSKGFCKNCNRLRITSKGDLRLCLFTNQGIGLRHLLQKDEQKPLLKQLIIDQLLFKKSSHFLAYGDTGITSNLALIGG